MEVPVAFSTSLQEDTDTDDNTIIFGIVDLNIEDGYDELTGNLITSTSFTFLFRKSSNHNKCLKLKNKNNHKCLQLQNIPGLVRDFS